MRRLAGSWAACAVVVTLWVTLAYAPAWRFPFIQDDIGLFNWIGGQSLFGLWTASPFGYYRPLTQMVWKIGELLAGRFDPVMLHAVNLAVHAIDALLVGYLAGRWLTPSDAHAPGAVRGADNQRPIAGRWLAASLFALYPFAFHSVPFVGALYHPLVSMLILGALAGHAAHRAGGRRAFLAIGLACAALAPFAHEAGLVAGPLLALAEIVSARARRRRPAWPIVAWGAAVAALGFAVWLSVPKLGPQTARPDFNGVLINLSYAVQALAYPISWIARPVVASTAVSDQVVVWVLGAAFVIVAALVTWRGGSLRLLALGLAVWAAGALPFSLALAPGYVLAAAWLLYEQSVGAVLVWCALFMGVAHPASHSEAGGRGISRLAKRFLAAARLGMTGSWLAVAILAFSLGFIRTRMIYYERLSDAVWDLAEAIQPHAGDRAALVVNFPRLARPPDRVYAIGVESPQFYARLAGLRDVLAVHGLASPGEVVSLSFGNLIPPLDYTIETMGRAADWPDLAAAIASVDRVYRSFPGSERIPIRYVGRPLTAGSDAPLVRFGSSVELIDAAAGFAGPGLLALALRWRYAGGADDASVFAHALNGAGQLTAQSDGPVMDMLPFWQWPPVEAIEEVRYIPLSAETRRVSVGLYDAATGERLAPIDANGRSYPDRAVPLFDIDPAAGSVKPLMHVSSR